MKSGLRVATALLLLTAASCGYDTSATFNADGSVTVGLKLLFPNALVEGANGASISGFSPTDLAAASSALEAKYPGAKVVAVTEGDESGASITIPFNTEKAAFDFMTAPPQLTPAGATSGTGVSLNLSNTGGLFSSAMHTRAGGVDTYAFTTATQPMPSPSPGSQQVISESEIASIFTITFSLTVPREITSAPGAVFTLDRKTAIWKLNWSGGQTITATTGPDTALVAAVAPAPNTRLAVVVGVIAIAIGLGLGMLVPWRLIRPAPAPPAETPPGETPPES